MCSSYLIRFSAPLQSASGGGSGGGSDWDVFGGGVPPPIGVASPQAASDDLDFLSTPAAKPGGGMSPMGGMGGM